MILVGESGFVLPSRPVGTQFVSFYCSSGVPILSEQQGSSHYVQIGQRTCDEQAVGILGHAAVAHLGKAEDALDDRKRMLALGAHLRFVSILRALGRRQRIIAARTDRAAVVSIHLIAPQPHMHASTYSAHPDLVFARHKTLQSPSAAILVASNHQESTRS
jgi:hypothetical protein